MSDFNALAGQRGLERLVLLSIVGMTFQRRVWSVSFLGVAFALGAGACAIGEGKPYDRFSAFGPDGMTDEDAGAEGGAKVASLEASVPDPEKSEPFDGGAQKPPPFKLPDAGVFDSGVPIADAGNDAADASDAGLVTFLEPGSEPNQNGKTATELGVLSAPHLYPGLSIANQPFPIPPIDQDFYHGIAKTSGRVDVAVSVSTGSLFIGLFTDQNGTIVRVATASISAVTTKLLTAQITAGQSFYVAVRGETPADHGTYAFQVTVQ